MARYPCDQRGRTNRSRHPTGDCEICRRHLCDVHLQVEFHPCKEAGSDTDYLMWKSYTAELKVLSQVLRDLDLVRYAEAARAGHRVITPLNLDASTLPRGMYNIVVRITFDDGIQWLARVRQIGFNCISRPVRRRAMMEEIAARQYLMEVVGVSVPRVHLGMQVEGGTDFYLMSVIPGKPCKLPIFQDTPPAKVSRIITGLAKFLVKVAEHPLRGVGPLSRDEVDGSWSVGSFGSDLSESVGPFDTPGERWAHVFQIKLAAIQAGDLHTDQREAAFVTWSWIRDTVALYAPYNQRDQETYVTHQDFKGDTMMADEEGNLTGIIDWESAYASFKCEAFAAPIGLMENLAVWEGSNELSSAEKELMANYVTLGRPDLAECVKHGKVYQRLYCICGVDGAWAVYQQLLTLAEAVGVEIDGPGMEEFLQAQRAKYGDQMSPVLSAADRDRRRTRNWQKVGLNGGSGL